MRNKVMWNSNHWKGMVIQQNEFGYVICKILAILYRTQCLITLPWHFQEIEYNKVCIITTQIRPKWQKHTVADCCHVMLWHEIAPVTFSNVTAHGNIDHFVSNSEVGHVQRLKRGFRPISQIPTCTCSVSHNIPWIIVGMEQVHAGICEICLLLLFFC